MNKKDDTLRLAYADSLSKYRDGQLHHDGLIACIRRYNEKGLQGKL